MKSDAWPVCRTKIRSEMQCADYSKGQRYWLVILFRIAVFRTGGLFHAIMMRTKYNSM